MHEGGNWTEKQWRWEWRLSGQAGDDVPCLAVQHAEYTQAKMTSSLLLCDVLGSIELGKGEAGSTSSGVRDCLGIPGEEVSPIDLGSMHRNRFYQHREDGKRP